MGTSCRPKLLDRTERQARSVPIRTVGPLLSMWDYAETAAACPLRCQATSFLSLVGPDTLPPARIRSSFYGSQPNLNLEEVLRTCPVRGLTIQVGLRPDHALAPIMGALTELGPATLETHR